MSSREYDLTLVIPLVGYVWRGPFPIRELLL
jgi:hypothetical protein